jgi:hypothetical protein
MGARQFPSDAQAEAVPRRLFVTSCAIEPLENVRCAFRWNSRSVVADTDLHNVIMFLGRNQNLTATSIVFYGILHQVLQRQRNHFLVPLIGRVSGTLVFDLKIVPSAEDPGIFQGHPALVIAPGRYLARSCSGEQISSEQNATAFT